MSGQIKYAAVVLLLAGSACGGDDAACGPGDICIAPSVTYKATLTGAAEVPAVTTNATGSATLMVDAGKTLTYTIYYSNLSSGITDAAIHGPATSGESAHAIVGFTSVAGTTSGRIGTLTLLLPSVPLFGGLSADSLIAYMNSGRTYVSVKTSMHPNGEIRGWLVKQ